MELTEKELTTIEKGRTKGRMSNLKATELRDSAIRKATKEAHESVANHKENCKNRQHRNELFLAKLKTVGDFVIKNEKSKQTEAITIYLDGKRETVDTINYFVTQGSIYFNGETLEETNHRDEVSTVEYRIGLELHTSGEYYNRKNRGYKMHLHGLMYCPNVRSDFGKRITKPEKIMTLIQDDILSRKNKIQKELDIDDLKERAFSELTEKYVGAEIQSDTYRKYRRNYDSFLITFDNGIQVNVSYEEDYNDESKVHYSVEEITSENKDGLELIDILGKL